MSQNLYKILYVLTGEYEKKYGFNT